jgi:hypothetical protein
MRAVHLLTRISLWLAGTLWLAPAVSAQVAAPDAASVAEQYLLAAANQDRAANGLPMLHRDPRLAQAALSHAQAMAARAAIAHQFPGEPELSARAAGTGLRFSVISENVGEAPSPLKLHDLWMHSTEHRGNLLDPAVDAAGISVVERDGELYAVEDFAKTVRVLSLAEQESAIASLIARSGGLAVDLNPTTTTLARQTCAMPTGYAGSRRPGFVMRFTSDSVGVLPDQLKDRLASGRFHQAAVGACAASDTGPFSAYNIAVLLYP